MITRDLREFWGVMEMIDVVEMIFIVVDGTYLSKLIKLYI